MEYTRLSDADTFDLIANVVGCYAKTAMTLGSSSRVSEDSIKLHSFDSAIRRHVRRRIHILKPVVDVKAGPHVLVGCAELDIIDFE